MKKLLTFLICLCPLLVSAQSAPVLDMAEYIGVEDEGEYFTEDDVEGVLQELAAGATPKDATYITQTPNADLTNEQSLSALDAGILKSNGSGVVSKAIADTDYLLTPPDLQGVTDEGYVTTNPLDAPAHNITDKRVMVTTFTAAGINAAIDALGAEGGEVYLPEGTYVMTDGTITIDYDNTTLTGAGAGTILDWSAGIANLGIDGNTKSYLTIQNISFLGPGGSAAAGFFIDGAGEYLTVQNCFFKDCNAAVALEINDSYGLVIKNYFTGSRGMDIKLQSSGSYSVIEGNTIYNSGGIEVNGFGSAVLFNILYIAKQIAIDLSASSVTCIGNTIRKSARSAIRTAYDDYITIIGNTIYNTATGREDILIDNCEYVTVIGNVLRGSGTSDKGIKLNNSHYNVVTGNVSRTHDVVGIEETSNCHDNLIYGNNCQDTTPYDLAGLTPKDFITTSSIGIKTTAPDGALEVNMGTADKIRLSYNDADGSATDYTEFGVDANGGLTIETVDSDGTSGNITLDPDGIVGVTEVIRGTTSLWWATHHHDMINANPGASGAALTVPTGSTSGGYTFTNSNHLTYWAEHVHSNWDAASDVEIILVFENGAQGAVDDTIDFQLKVYMKGVGDTATKLQTLTGSTIINDDVAFTQYQVTFTIDYDDGTNPLSAGDHIALILNLDTAASDVDNAVVNHTITRLRTAKINPEI